MVGTLSGLGCQQIHFVQAFLSFVFERWHKVDMNYFTESLVHRRFHVVLFVAVENDFVDF